MDQFEKYIEFTGKSFPIPNFNNPFDSWRREGYECKFKLFNSDKLNYSKNKLIDFWTQHSYACGYKLGIDDRNAPVVGPSLYSYLKSCQYTDNIIKEHLIENEKLNSLIYGMWDEINELKEHNKNLSERIFALENKHSLPPDLVVIEEDKNILRLQSLFEKSPILLN